MAVVPFVFLIIKPIQETVNVLLKCTIEIAFLMAAANKVTVKAFTYRDFMFEWFQNSSVYIEPMS